MKYSEVWCMRLSISFRPCDGPGGASQWLVSRCTLSVRWVLGSLTVFTVSPVWLGVVIFIVLVWMSYLRCALFLLYLWPSRVVTRYDRGPLAFPVTGWFPRFILFDDYIVTNTKWRKACRRKVMIVLLSLLSIDKWSSNSGRADGFRSE